MFGQLAHGDELTRTSPSLVQARRLRPPPDVRHVASDAGAQFFAGRRVTRVAAGLYHTLCVVDDRALYAVGGGVQGQLGLGDGRANSAAYTPRAVEALPPLEPDERIDQIACGLAHNLLLTSARPVVVRSFPRSWPTPARPGRGRVFAWGDGKMGELGLEDRSRTQATPREVEALRGVRVRRVAAGARHSLAAAGARHVVAASLRKRAGRRTHSHMRARAHADDGTLWAWGQGGDFQLGTGEQRNEPRPRAVALPTRGDVVCLAAGTGHSVAVVADHRS